MFLLHPFQTTHHASQGMDFCTDAHRMVPGRPRAAPETGARTAAVAFLFFVMVALWRPVASFEVPNSTGAEVATWAGHTWQQSRRGFGSCSHEGVAIGAGHRRSGRQRITRSKVVGCCSPGSRPLPVQVEECQAFIERSRNRLTRLEQERVAEQKELDAALVRLTRLREEMVRVPSPGPTQPVVSPPPPDPSTAEILQLRARVAELEVEKEELRKKRARSLSVPAPDLPGALSQSIVPLQVPARDRSELMATLIENGGTVAGSSHRFSPSA